MIDAPDGTLTGSLKKLAELGVTFATVIDLGCADGHFSLAHRPLFSGATLVNIDANPLYEPSLRAIQEVVGGHYFIGAATDHCGVVELIQSAHPYWGSLRPKDDPYWDRVNRLHAGKLRVEATTLDSLAERLRLQPPFLLKLDVQGAELSALRGASTVLQSTHAVICEADLDDFHGIHLALHEAGFGLFDLCEINRLDDRSLGWFYPVYLNRRFEGTKERAIWNATRNAEVIRLQDQRRQTVRDKIAQLLALYRGE
jgi:FkbM family methyltransferase